MKQGDEKACDIFVRKYYGEIFKYCKYRCFDIESAEDIVQETFVRFFANLPNYHFRGKTKNYLYKIAGNLCRDFYKKRKDWLTGEEVVQSDCLYTLDYVIDKVMLETAIQSLPQELQEVIILYYFHGLKIREIADMLQVSLSLVKYRLKQAKKKLGEFIGEEGFYGYTEKCRRI
jgi:RNA polymerase sigma factor, sigma-70 family